jgi:hypothetical protein
MSLINEALKKAQKQRTGEAPTLSAMPSIGGERPVNIARRGKHAGPGGLLLPIGLGFGALVVLIVGGIFLFRGKSPEAAPAPAAPTTVASTPAPTPTVSAPASAPAASTPPPATPTAAPVSTFVVPNVTTTAAPARSEPVAAAPQPVQPAPAPVVTTPVAQAPAPAPVVAAPAPEPVRPAAPPPMLEPRAINHIESLRVAGIRASATDPKDSKVLMNDRVYRIGNIVEAEMGLRLVEITSSSLTFEDARGGRYTRTF